LTAAEDDTPALAKCRPERLVSLPAYAKLRGVPYTTMHRTLMALARADVAEHGRCDWLLDYGRKRKKWLNLSRLARAHPVLFHTRFVSRDEFEGVVERVAELEVGQADLRRRAQAIAASVRDVRGEVTRRKAG